MLAHDIAGELPVPVLGRRPRVVRGPLRFARETRAALVPAFATRRGTRQTIHFRPELDASCDDAGARLGAAIDAAVRTDLAQVHPYVEWLLGRPGAG